MLPDSDVNEVLLRQLRRLGLSADTMPSAGEWRELLKRISDFYDETDRSRYLMERSMSISSQEMEHLNHEIRRFGEMRESHYRNLFNQSPIAIWEEDFSKVGAWLDWLRSSGIQDLQHFLSEYPEELQRLVGMIEIVDVNAAAVVLMRAPDKESLIGRMNIDFYTSDPTVLESFRGQLQAIWDGASRTAFEFHGYRWDESPLYGILHWSAPRIEGERDLRRVAVAIVDITERKQAEDRLSTLIRSKDEFLASVSHELRTPLTTVYASAETLLDQGDGLDDELRAELVGYIARESGELSDMVEDLLVAARHEIGTITIAPKQTDLLPIVERVAEVAFADHPDRDVALEVTGSVWADPLRLKQIVRNLVTNAIRYGGNSIRIQSETVGDDTYLTVLDDGRGVSPTRRNSIFEMYERDHGNLAPAAPVASVGVGLAVARQLAELMDGDLVYDYSGGWSRFRLRLPSAPAIPAPLASEADGIVTYIKFDRTAS